MTVEAVDDADFYKQLAAYELRTGLKHIPDTIVCAVRSTYKVPEPPALAPEKLFFENTPFAVQEKFLDL